MRYLLTACVVACLALGAGMAHAATPGQVPDSTLAAMGLGGLQPISDAQGTDIRGTGFASVSGFTYVKEGYTTVASSYHATAIGGTAVAVGGTILFHGVILTGSVAVSVK